MKSIYFSLVIVFTSFSFAANADIYPLDKNEVEFIKISPTQTTLGEEGYLFQVCNIKDKDNCRLLGRRVYLKEELEKISTSSYLKAGGKGVVVLLATLAVARFGVAAGELMGPSMVIVGPFLVSSDYLYAGVLIGGMAGTGKLVWSMVNPIKDYRKIQSLKERSLDGKFYVKSFREYENDLEDGLKYID